MKKLVTIGTILLALLALIGCSSKSNGMLINDFYSEIHGLSQDELDDLYIGKEQEFIGILLDIVNLEDQDTIYIGVVDILVGCVLNGEGIDVSEVPLYSKVLVRGILDEYSAMSMKISSCEIEKVYTTVDEKVKASDYSEWKANAQSYEIVEVTGSVMIISKIDTYTMIILDGPDYRNSFNIVFHRSVDLSEFQVGDEVTIRGIASPDGALSLLYGYWIR